MGVVGAAALAVNAGVALMLYRFRSGDANMRSVWICSRNDALGNLAVLPAALGVFGTGSVWRFADGGWDGCERRRATVRWPSRDPSLALRMAFGAASRP